ncbi:MAG: zinc ribbon domain-containing protein [Thermodesulfobacteriota bacterium]|nr:zinc ribbon domain-containing protein [Thermodesulfobacteriota bacterium]
MPIYEYECQKCNERFEILQKLSEDKNVVECPQCHTYNTQRVLSLFSSSTHKITGSGCVTSTST